MSKLKSPESKGAADRDLIATNEEQSAELRLLRKEVAEWRRKYEKGELRDIAFTNSEKEVQPIYTPLDAAETSAEALGMPGFYPYTRGVHPTGYRGRLWTMRQFAGFGSARDTNERYKFLLAHGQTGLSVAFDFPTLMGYDSDHPRSEGEVGKCGVAISSLADMETLFDGIPLAEVSTSMTINAPAAVLLCLYDLEQFSDGQVLLEIGMGGEHRLPHAVERLLQRQAVDLGEAVQQDALHVGVALVPVDVGGQVPPPRRHRRGQDAVVGLDE